MVKKKSLLLLLLFLFSGLVFSQTIKEDNFNIKKIIDFKDINNDSLIYYANKLKSSKNLCNYYHALNTEATAFYQKGNLKKAEVNVLRILDSLENKEEICFIKNKNTALNRLFWIYKNQNKFQEAFNVIIKRRKVLNSLPIKDNYFNVNNISLDKSLATIKKILGLHEEARTILKEMLPKLPSIYKGFNENDYTLKLNISSTLNTIGESYLESNKENTKNYLDSASVYFKKAFEVAKTFNPPHKNSEVLYQLRIAEILIAKEDFKEALKIIQKNDIIHKEFRVNQLINSLKAICFYQLKDNDSTLYYSKQFLKEHSKKSIVKKSVISIYDILANQYYKNKQIDSAYKYSELTIAELKVLNENKNEANKSHYLYDYKNAQELNKLILKKGKKTNNYYIIILLIIILLGIFTVYFLLKRNKKTSKDLTEIKTEINEKPLPQKKEYNIDEKLEKTLLNGINELEKNKDFLDPNFSINGLAKKLNTNTSYLSYIINKESNQSFKQYITELRIEYLIKRLIEEKKFRNYTIKSLAEEIGYTNASAFTRAFKKYKGITPSDFIKSLKEN
ncbi:AraC-type DNA-binding protein [Polaribacter sp. KT25b]|uniref:helix-turn-helix domain-containing protein n=1 Tax=Polaribacter sp. KT25b TaxID=1855336 RepID=UPI000879CB06|nr:AraC family transcriptional regulator [Polaribacter sp. KT25b]SDS21400.1 AraC-type DNA-binding protein [Polaribacter sp. KT25b]